VVNSQKENQKEEKYVGKCEILRFATEAKVDIFF
jgi:hypothetical protein